MGQGRRVENDIYGKSGLIARVILAIVRELEGDERNSLVVAMGGVVHMDLATREPEDEKEMQKRMRHVAAALILRGKK